MEDGTPGEPIISWCKFSCPHNVVVEGRRAGGPPHGEGKKPVGNAVMLLQVYERMQYTTGCPHRRASWAVTQHLGDLL